MKQFYDFWRTKTREYVSFADVVCFVPLVGYYRLHGEDYKDINKVTPVGRDKFGALKGIGTIEKPSKSDLRELDQAIEMATCQLIALPIGNSDGGKVLLNGSGRGKYTIPGTPCPCQVPLLSNNCDFPACSHSKPFQWWSGETCI